MQTLRKASFFAGFCLIFCLSFNAAAYASSTLSNQINTQFSSSHAEFVESILTSTNETNRDILDDRKELLSLETDYQNGKTLSTRNINWLESLAQVYKVNNPDFTSKRTWNELNKRVDIIPPSLVLAQAIEESGWGNSQLAKRANNYFGQRCGSSVCHENSKYTSYRGYASYRDIDEAISTYIHNLNSNAAYNKMRDIRYNERNNNEKINSTELVNGLNAYSVLRQSYVGKIKSVVRRFNLQQFDSI